MIHTVKGFGIVNKAEIDVFFWNSLAFSMIQWMLAIWSLVPLPFLNPAWTSESSSFTYYWSLAWRILMIILLECEMSAIVQYFEHSLALPFFFCKYKFIYFHWRLLYNIVLVLPCINMNLPWVYTCSPSWTLLPLRTIPLGRPSAPAPSIQYHASNLDWRFISYMILYMFQCHSPRSSHPLPLPQSPKGCSIHLCHFCCSKNKQMGPN